LQVDQWLFGTITCHDPNFRVSFALASAKWKCIGALAGKDTILISVIIVGLAINFDLGLWIC
jgi:hypothetical protein